MLFSLQCISRALPGNMAGCTENCVVVAEGELQHNGVFRASALGLPPVESRRTSEIAAKV